MYITYGTTSHATHVSRAPNPHRAVYFFRVLICHLHDKVFPFSGPPPWPLVLILLQRQAFVRFECMLSEFATVRTFWVCTSVGPLLVVINTTLSIGAALLCKFAHHGFHELLLLFHHLLLLVLHLLHDVTFGGGYNSSSRSSSLFSSS